MVNILRSNRRKQRKGLLRSFVRWLVCCDRGHLQRRIDYLEDHRCDHAGGEVCHQIDPDVRPIGNAENTNAQSNRRIECATRNITDGKRAGHDGHADRQAVERVS